MNFEHIQDQYLRLRRHLNESNVSYDKISLLNLAHCLRIWAEMKEDVDQIISGNKLETNFPNPTLNPEIFKSLNDSCFEYFPFAEDGEIAGSKIRGFTLINNKATSSEEEARKNYEEAKKAFQPKITKLNFSQWLGSGVFRIRLSGDDKAISVSREILIKRVANILGASHPQGKEQSDSSENRFDKYILAINEIKINEYPIAFYQLVLIAAVIIRSLKFIGDSQIPGRIV